LQAEYVNVTYPDQPAINGVFYTEINLRCLPIMSQWIQAATDNYNIKKFLIHSTATRFLNFELLCIKIFVKQDYNITAH